MRSSTLMKIAVRVMGNFVTEEDEDAVARVWRGAGCRRAGSTSAARSHDLAAPWPTRQRDGYACTGRLCDRAVTTSTPS